MWVQIDLKSRGMFLLGKRKDEGKHLGETHRKFSLCYPRHLQVKEATSPRVLLLKLYPLGQIKPTLSHHHLQPNHARDFKELPPEKHLLHLLLVHCYPRFRPHQTPQMIQKKLLPTIHLSGNNLDQAKRNIGERGKVRLPMTQRGLIARLRRRRKELLTLAQKN